MRRAGTQVRRMGGGGMEKSPVGNRTMNTKAVKKRKDFEKGVGIRFPSGGQRDTGWR